MITIDLSPDIQAPPNYQLIIAVAVILLVSCIISFSIPVIISKQIKAERIMIQTENTRKQEEIKKLKEELKAVEELKARLAEINKRAQDIKKLGEARKEPVVVLDQLQRQHLERMWLEEVQVEDKKKVTLIGWAVDHSVLAEYAKRLKQVNQELELEKINLDEFDPRISLMPQAFLPPEEEPVEKVASDSSGDPIPPLDGEAPAEEENPEASAIQKPKAQSSSPHDSLLSAAQEESDLKKSDEEHLANLSRIYGLKFENVHIARANEEMRGDIPLQSFEITFSLARASGDK